MIRIGYLFLLFLSFNGSAQNNIPKAQLDKVILALAQQYKVPNFSIAITTSDSIIYNFNSDTNGINAVYLIGSNTKSFTALSVLKLVDKGSIDLDKPVSEYLQWFSFGNETPTNKITVRNLLNQTSGIPTTGGFFEDRNVDLQTFERDFSAYLKKLSPANQINQGFAYSNANYVLLGLIIQHVSGRIYGDFVRDSIFKPLNMTSSSSRFNNGFSPQFVTGYQYAFLAPIKSKTEKFQDFQVAQGRIASSSNDMSRYLRAMLKGATSIGLMQQSFQNLISPNKAQYAMGWSERNYYGEKVIQHLGENENFCSAMFFMPQRNLGVIALTNVNSLELNSELENAIVLTLQGKVYQEKVSVEWIERIALLVVCLIIFSIFIKQVTNLFKFKYSFCIPSLIKVLGSSIRIILSLLPSIIIPRFNKIPLTGMIQYAPDFAFGLILIAVVGCLSGFIRLFGSPKILAP